MTHPRQQWHWQWRALGLLLSLLFVVSSSWAETSPLLVELGVSGKSEVDQRVAYTLQRMLGEAYRVRRTDDPAAAAADEVLVRVTLGDAALREVQGTDLATIALFVTDSSFARISVDAKRQTAIYYNPPLIRQARLARLVLPRHERIAILEGATDTRLNHWKAQLEADGFSVQLFLVDNPHELVAVLNRALTWGDYVLGTPDPALFNGTTLKHVLLTTYRRGKTLIGPSQAFVNAGALASTHTSLEQFVLDAVRIVESYARSRQLPPPSYAENFNVIFNHQVARSLNLPLPDVNEVEQALRALETAKP